MMTGKLISFEGIDGCGKTTQAELLATRLRHAGLRVTVTNEPAGTPLGEDVKDLLLFRDTAIDAEAELLLFFAARAQHFSRVLKPHLADGRIVVCDRFLDSTLAYQGYGRGIAPSALKWLENFTTEGLIPDLTFFLDVAPSESLDRCGGQDRIESETKQFWDRIYRGFVLQALDHPDRIRRVDGNRPIPAVANEIWQETASFLNLELLRVRQSLRIRGSQSYEAQISSSNPATPLR
jgi:dTMP kinase